MSLPAGYVECPISEATHAYVNGNLIEAERWVHNDGLTVIVAKGALCLNAVGFEVIGLTPCKKREPIRFTVDSGGYALVNGVRPDKATWLPQIVGKTFVEEIPGAAEGVKK